MNSFSFVFPVFATLAVAFVNGMTDAPNAIVSCVSTGCISIKKAVIIASVSDFAGSLTMGIINSAVSETVVNIADFGNNTQSALAGLTAAMIVVVGWAVAAWLFGIPTSESHAMIASLSGASLAVKGGLSQVSVNAWKKVVQGLLISLFAGFAAGYTVSKSVSYFFEPFTKEKSYKTFKYSQIFSSALMSFMHGAQDSQKFSGIITMVLSFSGCFIYGKPPLLITILCALFISLGTVFGGERIIKAIGSDMLKMKNNQGFSADIAGSLCLVISTALGMPVSTTHAKTSAIIGVGVAESSKSLNWKVASDMLAAWIITFPFCCALGWVITKLFLCAI